MTERKETTWEEIERPVGPQPIPAWCKGAHVNWMDGYGNAPNVEIKAVGEDWHDKIFRIDGKRYIAEHPDGRGEMHVHDGRLLTDEIQVFRSVDGTIQQNRRFGPEWGTEPGIGTILNGVRSGHEPGEFIKMPMLCTTQQDGYAGRHFWIKLNDGRDLVLRGPWHCGAPPGYRSITTVDMDWAGRNGMAPRSPWWKNLGCFGLGLREDVYIAVLSRFLPHLPLARVAYSYGGTGIEPYKPEWGEPKHFWLDRQRKARAA